MAKTKTEPASTQAHLRIAEIRDGCVILTNSELRQVILVSSVNFALKSEDEQNAIVFQFQNFLNSLTFPIQIVMQSRRLDLSPYLAKLQERLDSEQNELVRLQIVDYMEFIRRLLSVANIMDKNFFVVVPFSPPVAKKGGFVSQIFGSSKREEVKIPADQFASYKQSLAQRASVISGGLSSVGLRSALLSTQQLVELFYATYNPEEATKERLTYTQLLSAPIIKREEGMFQPVQTSYDFQAPPAPPAPLSPPLSEESPAPPPAPSAGASPVPSSAPKVTPPKAAKPARPPAPKLPEVTPPAAPLPEPKPVEAKVKSPAPAVPIPVVQESSLPPPEPARPARPSAKKSLLAKLKRPKKVKKQDAPPEPEPDLLADLLPPKRT